MSGRVVMKIVAAISRLGTIEGDILVVDTDFLVFPYFNMYSPNSPKYLALIDTN